MDYNDGIDEFSEGFQIENENLDGSKPAEDAASAWLMSNDNEAGGFSYESEEGTEHVSPNELVGMSTEADIILAKFKNAEPRIQAGLISAVNGTLSGVDEIDRAAAVEQFGEEIGGDPVAFVKQLKVDASVENPRHKQDLRTVLSMLGTTSGEGLDKGPGSRLAGHTLNGERREKKEAELTKALGYVKELAGLYIDGRTLGSSIEGTKRLAIEQSLTNRFMNGVMYEGAKSIMPLPNELFHNGTDGSRVTGTIVTQGVIPSQFGTSQNRLSGSDIDGSSKLGLAQIPNLSNSLHPKPYKQGVTYSEEEIAKRKRDQAHAMSQTQYKADFARSVLLEQMPTHRDESAQQGRTAGFDRPYEEQERVQNLRDEATRRGLDWYAGDDPSELTLVQKKMLGAGSDRSGMYGQKAMSDVDEFVENVEDGVINLGGRKVVPGGSDRAAYLSHLEANPQPSQGSQEWLDQRKGNITASVVIGGFGTPALLAEGGVEARALELAKERAGKATPFVGNSHTKDGNDGEAAVLASFLAGPGRDFAFEEAFFESGEKNGMPGWGVSPDGRLYDQLTGASEGLLELKYLSNVKGSAKKYNDQMQTQMMVTGESKTNFYALNKYTGEYEHNVIHADPDRQAQLKSSGDMAISMSTGLDARGLQALRDKSGKTEARKPADAQGQTEAFGPPKEEAAEAMTAFGSTGTINRAESTIFAEQMKKMEDKEQVAKAKDILNGDSEVGTAPTQIDPRAGMQAKANFANNNKKPGAFGVDPDSEMANHYKKEEAEASKKATESMRKFSDATSAAVSVLGTLGAAIVDGNKSGMDEVRLAAETGLDVKNIRGMRKVLEKGGMSDGQINSSINQVGNLTKTFNDEIKAADAVTDILTKKGVSNLPSIRNMELPDFAKMKSMNPQEWASMIVGKQEGMSMEGKAQVDNLFGTSFATNDKSGEDVGNAYDKDFSEYSLRDTWEGIKDVTQWTRDFGEGMGGLGQVAGTLGAGAVVAAGVASSMLGGNAGGFMGKGGKAFMNAAKGGSSKLSNLANAAKSSPKIASMTKSLSTAAKATPMAAAFAVAPMAVRHLGDIKDDGGVGDSAMDVLEWAGYGAAVGSVVPGLGTAVGAGIGTGIGVANEIYEWATDDALPDESIGKMPSPQGKASTAKMTNNVEVSVEINGSEYAVKTDVNGDELLDEGSGVPT